MAVLPIRIVSEANTRSGVFAKAARVKAQRTTVTQALNAYFGVGTGLIQWGPLDVVLTRLAPLELDDDNCVGGCKAPRDAVAQWLGVSDRKRELVRYIVRQERSKAYGLRIFITRRKPSKESP